MALVRGVICLSLSDWAPAVAPSLAPLHSLRPTTPHLSQMGGWMEAGRKVGGEGGGWRREGQKKRQGRAEEKSANSQQAGLCVMYNSAALRRMASWGNNGYKSSYLDG